MEPVTVEVKTRAGEPTLDGMAAVELTVHRSRDVASLKNALRRQLPGRPPVDTIRLLHGGAVLRDDLLVNEILEDQDEDDDEDEEDDEEDDLDEEGGGGRRRRNRLVLQLDMVPPVDPRFVTQLPSQMDGMTVSELLDAYAYNEAAALVNAQLLLAAEDEEGGDEGAGRGAPGPSGGGGGDDEEGDGESDEAAGGVHRRGSAAAAGRGSVTARIREAAAQIRADLDATVLRSEASRRAVREGSAPALASRSPNLQERQVRGQRVRQAAQGGVRTTLRRKVQRNLNVNWPDTARHFCLFLFFGYFGGRTPLSRAVLLLGAPSVFLLQARPVKRWIRRALHAAADHPPPILLSLLPAPQQSILSLDVQAAMEAIYGDHAAEARGEAGEAGSQDSDEDEAESEGDDDEESVEEADDIDDE
jgi:hypothetical protein